MVTMQELLIKTYKRKKVFITGHTGFKGAWLLKIMSLLGAEIKGFALNPLYENDLYNLIEGAKLCDSIIGDLRDRETLQKSVLEFQPDFIFHLAAQPLVRLSYDIPSETFEVNAIGTANLLEAVRFLKKRCQVILITTDKVYHNNEWDYPYRENDRLGGYDPYSASKACAELVINSYRNSFFNIQSYSIHQKAIAVCRAGNVIGGGDWSENRLLPDIMKSLSKNETVIIRNPSATRPWQHVLEPLIGYLLLGSAIEKDPIKYSEAYNFGPNADDALTVENMVKLSIEKWGNGTYESKTELNQPHEAGLLKLDINKVIAELGWRPRYNASKAVEVTVDWYKCFFDKKESIIDATKKQITEFIDNA